MGKGTIAGSIIGSIIGSVAIVAVLAFFMIPLVFPAVNTNSIVVQSKFGEWDSPAYIFDDQTSNYIKMTDTEINITTEGNSRISMTLFAIGLLSLQPNFNVRNSYNISLVVVGVSNRTFEVAYFDNSGATGAYRQLTLNLYSNYVTQSLPAGTYTTAVYWKSTFNATDTNSLSVSHATTWNRTRSLIVQEIKEI
jgi:hypothetical protein